tara:strand:- start:73566 stop:74258 length:693 start_codon:yes stop_codon:yes gene_type:complete
MGRERKKNHNVEPVDIIIDTRSSPQSQKDKIHNVVKDSNKTAHRILDIAQDTRDIADSTNDKVHEQGEQIDDIAGTVADTNFAAHKAKSHAKNINSVWHAIGHAIKKFFTPKCLQSQKTEIDDTVKDVFQSTRDKERADKKKGHHKDESGDSKPAITILFDSQTQVVDADTFETLTTVEDVLGQMNSLARQTNREVRRQNGVLDQVKDIAIDTNETLDDTNAVAKKYLKA